MAEHAEVDRFFLPADYRANTARPAAGETEYWTPRRIETSALFQWHVYKRARALARGVRDARVLDIGCGSGRKATELVIPWCARYVGVDRGEAVEHCRRTINAPNASFVVDDLEHPLARWDEQFDVVICADVIEHLEDPEPMLKAARAAMAESGRLVLSTPERSVVHGASARQPGNPEHVREWDRRELRAYLEASGFRVIRLSLAPQFRVAFSDAGRRLLRGQASRPFAYWGCQVATCVRS